MKKYLILLISVMTTLSVLAQKEKFDIATFVPPKGWQRIDSNGVVMFHNYHTSNGLTSFCQIYLYPCRVSSGDPKKDFSDEWSSHVAGPTGSSAKPETQVEKTPEGWTVTTGIANITQQGVTYTCMLLAASGFGKVMTSVVNMAGQDFVPEVEGFFTSLDLDSEGTVKTNSNGKLNGSQKGGLDAYNYLVPDQWHVYKTNQGIVLSQNATVEYGCLITIYPLQASSGDLEKDARGVFAQMYPGWQFRYTGEKRDELSKGYTLQGLEFCMYKADMHKMRPDGYYYDYEDPAILVIGVGSQVAVITAQHNRNFSCFCFHKYENWRRFFNSFTINNQPSQGKAIGDVPKLLLGSWMSSGGSALNEYIFAANGNYQYIGAYGTTSKTTDAYYEYTHIKTSAFKGDGSYTINGNKLIMSKHGRSEKEIVQFRIEKVNYGSTGWKERLYMLQKSLADGKEFEVCYDRRN